MKEIGGNPYPTLIGIDMAHPLTFDFSVNTKPSVDAFKGLEKALANVGAVVAAHYIEPVDVSLSMDEINLICDAFEDTNERKAAIALVKELIKAYERI